MDEQATGWVLRRAKAEESNKNLFVVSALVVITLEGNEYFKEGLLGKSSEATKLGEIVSADSLVAAAHA
ncbi:hypothetical protein RYX56_25425, partial [Alkalihalophilus lindianensis]